MEYRNSWIVQLTPVHGEYYAVCANDRPKEEGEPLFFKHRVPVLALVEEWTSLDYRESGPPPPGEAENRTRRILPVLDGDGYHDVSDDDNTIGFWWAEELTDPEVLADIEAEVRERRAQRLARKS